MTSSTSKTLVLGLGNPLLSDDGIGVHVAREVKRRLSGDPAARDVEVKESSAGGAALVLILEGFEEAIIVDAIATRQPQPGKIHVLDIEQFAKTFQTVSPHGINMYTALQLGRRCGLSMPSRVRIVAMEILDAENVGETFTPEVGAAANEAVEIVYKLLNLMIY